MKTWEVLIQCKMQNYMVVAYSMTSFIYCTDISVCVDLSAYALCKGSLFYLYLSLYG